MMAQVRSIYTPAEWGWVEQSATASVASQTSFKLGGNQTTNWTAGRRWRLKSGSTTRYGSVVSSSFTAETTITVTVDSGSLSASHSLAALAGIDSNHTPAFAAGSASAPSITTTGDTNTGFWFPAADTIAASTGGSERWRADSSGNLLLGLTSTISGSNTLQVENAAGDSTQIRLRHSSSTAGNHWRIGSDNVNTVYVINQASAGVYILTGGTSWSALSDERMKDIIEPITVAVEKVSGLRAVIGKYTTDEVGVRRSFLIAQDVQAVLPEAVSVSNPEPGNLGLSYTEVIPLLVAAIKEQRATITSLETRVAALEAS
jgi:hypothetical protein